MALRRTEKGIIPGMMLVMNWSKTLINHISPVANQ